MVQACYCSMPVLAANNAFAARELFGLPSATEIRSLTSSSLSISTPCLMPSPLSMYTTSSVATLPAHQMHVFLLQGVTKHMHEHQSVHMGQLGNADLHSKKATVHKIAAVCQFKCMRRAKTTHAYFAQRIPQQKPGHEQQQQQQQQRPPVAPLA